MIQSRWSLGDTNMAVTYSSIALLCTYIACAPRNMTGKNDDHPVMEPVSSPDGQLYTATIRRSPLYVEL